MLQNVVPKLQRKDIKAATGFIEANHSMYVRQIYGMLPFSPNRIPFQLCWPRIEIIGAILRVSLCSSFFFKNFLETYSVYPRLTTEMSRPPLQVLLQNLDGIFIVICAKEKRKH